MRQLNQQTLVRFDIKSRDEEHVLVRRDLHEVVALTKLLASLIKDHAVLIKDVGLSDYRHGALGPG